ncbi:MAG: hypothetical protein K9M84_10425 [Spirochaetia bacterium]|nr:hypothetical protein [Spirochaetia bacterium]MCF7942020.1 hypothetical protein [Spirochaetia bacterium]
MNRRDIFTALINTVTDEVMTETARRMKDLGTGGGYSISTCHTINWTSHRLLEHRTIMFETIPG